VLIRAATLLFSFGLLPSSCASTDERPATIVVASDLDNMPFAGVAADGTAIGRDVEMMQLLAGLCGCELQWRRMAFERLLPTVEAGSVDVVCATIGITPEREQRVLFTEPYFETTIALVVRVGADEPRTLAELHGRRVLAGAGTTSERAVQRHLPDAVGVFEGDKGLPAAQRLLEHDVDAAAMDGPAADQLVRTSHGRLRRIALALTAEHYALVLPKGRAALRDRLDAALRELRETGELDRLDARHGLR
jgi:ABC-type amino acid transport substrate-binding protein